MKTPCYIKVTLYFKKEKDGRWTAECRELGTATLGNTFEEARELIAETIELHLDTLKKNGQIERFFRENGIRIIRQLSRAETSKINIPCNKNIFVNTYPVKVPAGFC